MTVIEPLSWVPFFLDHLVQTDTHTHTLGSIATYSFKLTEYKKSKGGLVWRRREGWRGRGVERGGEKEDGRGVAGGGREREWERYGGGEVE